MSQLALSALLEYLYYGFTATMIILIRHMLMSIPHCKGWDISYRMTITADMIIEP